MTKWKIYYGLNRRTRTMRNPLEQALIFLGYVRGPHVDKWVDDQIQETHNYIRNNADPDCDWHEHIWDRMINDFARTFQDLMSKEQARSELNNLKMEKGDLDAYTTRFRHLARMALYRETDTKLCEDYFKGLPAGLQRTMITMEPMDRYQVLGDWVEGAIRHHRKFMQLQAHFGTPPNKNNPRRPSKQQWQQGFARDPNAMDTSAGRTRAWAALTKEEKGRLMKEGRCFNCKNMGHRSRECPDKKNQTQIRAGETKEPEKEDEATTSAVKAGGTKPLSAAEIVELVRNMEEGEKEKVIEEVFMQDFA